MKAIIIICVCVALLPSIIYSGSGSDSTGDPDEKLNEAHDRLEDILKKGKNINNVFQPMKFLGKGSSSVTYLGKMIRTNETVAMKFSPTSEGDIEREYEMYSYMRAINNTSIETIGIPAVYYYGKWEDCSMIAVTPLEPQFNQIERNPQQRTLLKELDIFIICREYVRISKFIHSRGICHKDSHPGNIMFRGNKAFVIDFNLGIRVTAAIGYDCRKDDWRQFLLNMCDLAGIAVDWTKETFKKIPTLQSKGLKKVFSEMLRCIYKMPQLEYNRMFNIINTEIRNVGVREPAMVSWLTDQQKRQAMVEWTRLPTSEIKFIGAIPNPYTVQFSYPSPNYTYFENR